MVPEDPQTFSLEIPEPADVVAVTGENAIAFWRYDTDGVNRGKARKNRENFTRMTIPDPYGAIVTAGNYFFAVPAETDGRNIIGMPLKDDYGLRGRNIP